MGPINSKAYSSVLKSMNPAVEVFGKACPLFVPLVEEGLLHDTVTDEIASRYLSVLKEKYIDTLVMGCTHYPLIRSTIARTMGDEVTLVNPAYETAVQLRTLLRSMEMDCDGDPGGPGGGKVPVLCERYGRKIQLLCRVYPSREGEEHHADRH